MAEKKVHNIVSADADGTAVSHNIKDAKPVGNAAGLRIGAIILWLCAIGLEVCALLVLQGKLNLKFIPSMYQLVGFLVIDLIFVIIGSQLWKKANHIRPASKKNKALFWLYNNMGVIVCVIAFLPIIIIMLSNKELDKKTKAIAIVVAIIALLIGGLASYDFNPVSAEEQQTAISTFGDDIVYWAPFGKVYHTHEDCGSLNQTDTLTQGTVDQAIASNRTRLCAFCAHKDDIDGVRIDGESDE